MFKTGKQLPSNEEVVGVDKLLGDETSSGYSDTDMEKINALIKAMDIHEEERLPRWEDDSQDCFRQRQVHDDFQILRTREERWRLARLEGRLADLPEDEDAIESSPDEPAVEDDISDVDERLEDDRPAKRLRMDNGAPSDPDLLLPAKHSSHLPSPLVNYDTQSIVTGADAPVLDNPAESRPASNLEVNDMPRDELAGTDLDFAPLESGLHDDNFADDFDENKENWPPSTPSLPVATDGVSSDYHTPEHMRQYLAVQYDMDDSLSQGYPDLVQGPAAVVDEGSFQLLSFDSKPRGFDSQLAGKRVPEEMVDTPYEDEDRQAFVPVTNEVIETVSYTETARRQPDKERGRGLLIEPSIASCTLGTSAFAQLRARKVSSLTEVPIPQVKLPGLEVEPALPEATREDVVDQDTLKLPRIINAASSMHRYMASFEFIQKHALVRALSSAECAIELAERTGLVGVDLILDPYSAIIILPLFRLSSRRDSYVERVAQQSWRYSKLLIVFEAYPEQLSGRSSTKYGVDLSGTASDLWAYTPPIIKAVKKFRRDLSVVEGCGSKDPQCKVTYAFADTVNEAALFIRFFGDQVEAEDETQGELWGEREWLAADSVEVSVV